MAPHLEQSVVPRSRAFLPFKSALAIAAALVAILAVSVIAYRSLELRSETARWVQHTNAVQGQIDRVFGALRDAETGQRGFLLTANPAYLEPYNAVIGTIDADLDTLRSMVADNPEQAPRVAELKQIVATRVQLMRDTIEAERANQHDAAIELLRSGRGRTLMGRIRVLIDLLRAEEASLLIARNRAWEDSTGSSAYATFGGLSVIFVTLLLVGWFASRDFRVVEDEAWSRRVALRLNRELQGDLGIASLSEKVLRVLSDHTNAAVGAVYVVESGGRRFTRAAARGLEPDARDAMIQLGDGLAGQAAKEDRLVHLTKLPADYLPIRSGVGGTAPREVVIAPASVDDEVQAIVELGYLQPVDAIALDILERATDSIGVAIRSARDRRHLEALLEETQRQAEELQAQQEELRVTNEELEQQSRALQVSQTQLENQQSELEQINAQLEEQTHALERQRDELARAGGELQRSNEYKSQFLANMSHELRTPLNSSLILAKLLADNRQGNLDEEQIKFAKTIYAAGNDLLTLINDILDLSKIEAGMLDVRPEPISIERAVAELRDVFQPIATHKGLQLELRIEPGVARSFETDATRLQQILKNLLSNALKFTERGQVTLVVSGRGEAIDFAVRDSGIGIAPDQHELIFEAFRQADGGMARKFGGTGLGLSISRDLARLLGGELRVESAPGRGSTFTLSLPLVAPVAPAKPRTMTPIQPVTLTRPEPLREARPGPFVDDRARATPAGRSLLVIEDDVTFARVLYDLAHELEFQGLVAATADDGLALARQFLPSAIVLDVGLPDRSGLAVLDALKRDPRTRHIPVHVVSGSDYTRTALEMGAAGYALKPIERDHLVDAIKKLEAKFTQKLRRVLIVEDDPLLRESTAKLLAGDGVETITAGTTAQALTHLRATTFDCMVLDLSLPDRSGLELLEEMARGDQTSFPPVIVYTGRSLSTDQVHELEKLARSIIIKGARSPERLLDEVTLFLHQVEAELPPERQRMLRDARDRETVFEGRRILIVEDDVRNVFALASVLEPKGAVVEIARNGREALDQLAQQPEVDLVLMDIMMPEMDGLEATRRIRQQARFAKLPIIALTAKAMIDDRDKCIEAGANDYIAKPLDVDKLLSLARVWIRK